MNFDIKNTITEYEGQKHMLKFFDINCWYDTADTEKFHVIDNMDQLANWLSRKKVDRAVITNAKCIKYDPFIGNDQLESIIGPYGNLYGSMVISPEILYKGINHMKEYIRNKLEHKFVMARFFPKRYYHSMEDFVLGDILKYLQELRLPVMLWHGETTWEDIHSLCTRYPELPVIIDGNPTKLLYHNRNYMALLKTHKYLYIETHGLIQFDELDYLVSAFGAERFLFGSYSPYNDPDVTMSNICYADINSGSKRKISFENMDRLINNINM